VLYLSGEGADLDGVTDAILVLDEDKKPPDEIFDQGLGTEAEGQAAHTGAGKQGSDVDVKVAEQHQDRGADDHGGDPPTDHLDQRQRLLPPLLGQALLGIQGAEESFAGNLRSGQTQNCYGDDQRTGE
jgi:hypothetical protein